MYTASQNAEKHVRKKDFQKMWTWMETLQVWQYFLHLLCRCFLWCIYTFLRSQDYIAFDGKTLLREPSKYGLWYTEYMYVMGKRFVRTLWIHLHYLWTQQTAGAVYKRPWLHSAALFPGALYCICTACLVANKGPVKLCLCLPRGCFAVPVHNCTGLPCQLSKAPWARHEASQQENKGHEQ